jgi:Phytanoyl-CoA dioxygenase (PhyH)
MSSLVSSELAWLGAAADELIDRGYTVFNDVVSPNLGEGIMDQLRCLRPEFLRPTAPGVLEAVDGSQFEALYELLNLDCITKLIASLFVGQGRLLSAAARMVAPGTLPQQLHRDYPTNWPIHRSDQTVWSVYPSLIVACYPDGLTDQLGPLLVAPGTHRARTGDEEAVPVPVLAGPTDLIVFDAAVLHGSGANNEARVRYACFLDFAPSYVRRPYPVRPLDDPTESQTLLMGKWFQQ